jgi:hypothetical protein
MLKANISALIEEGYDAENENTVCKQQVRVLKNALNFETC